MSPIEFLPFIFNIVNIYIYLYIYIYTVESLPSLPTLNICTSMLILLENFIDREDPMNTVLATWLLPRHNFINTVV